MTTGVVAVPVSLRRVVIQTGGLNGGSIPLKALVASASLLACASVPTQGVAVSSSKVSSTVAAPSFVAREQDVQLSGPEALTEVRKRSALTWEQLASVLHVSRRAVHLWMSGQPMKLEHREALQTLLDRVRSMSNKSAFVVKQLLLKEHGIAVPALRTQLASESPIPAYRHDDATPVVTKRASEANTRVRRG